VNGKSLSNLSRDDRIIPQHQVNHNHATTSNPPIRASVGINFSLNVLSDASLVKMEDSQPYLPAEMADQIIHSLIFLTHNDPTYQWTQLRHISYRYKVIIEKHFRKFWLPRLTITAYCSPLISFDYKLAHVQNDINDADMVWFDTRMSRRLPTGTSLLLNGLLDGVWKEYSFEKNSVILRLGELEPLLSGDGTGGHLINDTELPDLYVEKRSMRIRFNWKRVFEEFFREERFMTTYLKRLVDAEIRKMAGVANSKIDISNYTLDVDQTNSLLGSMVGRFQLGRRIAVLRQRAKRHDPTGETLPSALKQPLPFIDISEMPVPLRDANDRARNGGLLEIVIHEEFMTFKLPGWDKLPTETLWQVLAWEHAWRDSCLTVKARIFYAHKERDAQFREARAKWWLQIFKNSDGVHHYGRWQADRA
jgi:hypothetical protein